MSDWGEVLKPTKLCWWKKLLMFFKKPVCGVDWGGDILCVVCTKELFGITYIVNCEINISKEIWDSFQCEDTPHEAAAKLVLWDVEQGYLNPKEKK